MSTKIEDKRLDDALRKYDDSDDNFEEVVQLTEYLPENGQTGMTPQRYAGASMQVVAEYTPVDLTEIDEKSQKQAKTLVNKIKEYIIKYSPTELDQAKQDYLNAVAELEISGLADMIQLCMMNKVMISNLVNKVNDTFGEDFAAIQSYTNLVNLHMKLMKDLQVRYKNIPTLMKRMKTDIETEQVLSDEDPVSNDVISDKYGETQFNSGRELYNKLTEEGPIVDEDAEYEEIDVKNEPDKDFDPDDDYEEDPESEA